MSGRRVLGLLGNIDVLPKNAVRRKLCIIRRDPFNAYVSFPRNSILVRIKEIRILTIAFVLDVTVKLFHLEDVRTTMPGKVDRMPSVVRSATFCIHIVFALSMISNWSREATHTRY
jgi:hypothetical protein